MKETNCALASVLEIIGDKWSLLIIRNLIFLGHHEYKEFLSMPESISTNILANRLKKLEKFGILSFAIHTKYRNRKLYYLTASGKDLIFIMKEIIFWGDKYLDNIVLSPHEEDIIANQDYTINSLILKQEAWEHAFVNYKGL